MDRIKELISKMTLEEKASLCSGADNWHTKEIKRLNIPSVMMVDGPHGLRKQDGTDGRDAGSGVSGRECKHAAWSGGKY